MAVTSRSNHTPRLAEFGDIVLSADAVYSLRSRWGEHFGSRLVTGFDGRIIVDVGCSDAELLVTLAGLHPSTAFVGIDWKAKAIVDGAERVRSAGLRNVMLLRGRAQDMGRIFAPAEVHEIWIFHPDPCDRPAELKNRLVASRFLGDACQALRGPGARIAIKTDHPGYYQWMLALFGLPQPSWFEAARRNRVQRGRSPVTDEFPSASPKVRAADIVAPESLPQPDGELMKLVRVVANVSDLRSERPAQFENQDRIHHCFLTRYERRFTARRLPIYYLELERR